MRINIISGLFICFILFSAACSNPPPSQQNATSANINKLPTSEVCAGLGGISVIAHTLDGLALQMCQLPNGKRCEERTLKPGRCIL